MTATVTAIGRYGAKRVSFRPANPRDVLNRMITDNPRALGTKIRDLVWADIKDDEEMLMSVFEYWFTNNYRSIGSGRGLSSTVAAPSIVPSAAKAAPLTPAERKRRAKEKVAATIAAKAKVESVVRSVARLSLLSMELPNGKSLGETTGKELTKFKTKMPAFLSAVASKVKPSQKVGDVFDDGALWKLYRAA